MVKNSIDIFFALKKNAIAIPTHLIKKMIVFALKDYFLAIALPALIKKCERSSVQFLTIDPISLVQS